MGSKQQEKFHSFLLEWSVQHHYYLSFLITLKMHVETIHMCKY